MSPSLAAPPSTALTGAVLLYDGDCGLCNALVGRLRASPSGDRIAYLALQSIEAQTYLSAHGLPTRDFTSVVFVPAWEKKENSKPLLQTDGLIAALSLIGGRYRCARWLRLLPRPIRDGAYTVVARFRHHWPK